MANFFDPQNDPQNKDGISEMYIGKGKTAFVALYGGGWNGSDLFVRVENKNVVTWGEDKARRQPGPHRFFGLTGMVEGETVLRATLTKDGHDDFLTPVKLYVVGTNAELLNGTDPRFVYPNTNEKYPLDKHYGPAMMQVRGMAVHTTGGDSQLSSLKGTWEARPASAHFAIDKEGKVAQYVALCYQAWAQGPGNPFWISVEIVGTPDGFGKGASMTEAQIREAAKLFRWLSQRYGFPLQLAAPLVAEQRWMGNVYTEYQTATEAIANESGVKGVTASADCVSSTGLSCHLWLQPGIKPCPGLDIIKQMPQIVKRA